MIIKGNIIIIVRLPFAGEHVIEVLYLNKPIAGSPFHCQVFDWAKINVSKLPQTTVTDRLVDFDSQ